MPYIEGFDENQIPTKARPIQMNQQMLEYYKKEIQDLLDKNLIRKSHFGTLGLFRCAWPIRYTPSSPWHFPLRSLRHFFT